jgi:uncharacterized protein (TIGR02231 family)
VQINKTENESRRVEKSIGVPSQVIEKQTSVDFEIKIPYTVNSDGKSLSIVMENYFLPADYLYYSVPKIDKNAFLIAHINQWEKYNLLEGEANIFFEDTYVGKSILDTRYAKDTLKISLGRDKSVFVTREKSKEFVSNQFIGSKKEDTRDWLITVKNNKTQKIKMMILDQVPVSTIEEIEIELQKSSGGIQNKETGELKWEFSLDSNEMKEFSFKYSVKYPKNRTLFIE